MTDRAKGLKGKTCLVTGATSGIGEVTALELAGMGASVIVAGRNPDKCRATVTRIREVTGNCDVELLLADLSSQAQVRALAGKFLERHDRLDVLVNNAGSAFPKRRLSADGIEMTFALNHLSYFLLTNLLLETITSHGPARIVNVSSNAHYGSPVDLNDLQLERDYSVLKAYDRSKFANVLFTYELARRLEGTGVTANALHPGLVATNIVGHHPRLVQWGWKLYVHLRGGLTVEEGASTSLYLASSPEVEGVSGAYFAKGSRVLSDPATYDEAAARKLWEVSAQLTALSPKMPWLGQALVS